MLAILLAPVMPKATLKLWNAIADQNGELSNQRISDAGNWPSLKPGQEIRQLDVLFPRIEEA